MPVLAVSNYRHIKPFDFYCQVDLRSNNPAIIQLTFGMIGDKFASIVKEPNGLANLIEGLDYNRDIEEGYKIFWRLD
jgi:hypothetical protein